MTKQLLETFVIFRTEQLLQRLLFWVEPYVVDLIWVVSQLLLMAQDQDKNKPET